MTPHDGARPEPESDLSNPARPLAGILGGAIVGGALYGFSRGALPGDLAVGAVVVGLASGVGARLVRAIGSPAQLRVLVFASLFATVIGEWFYFSASASPESVGDFAGHLLRNKLWLLFTVLFLIGGIFIGVRLLVGGDPMEAILEHTGSGAPPTQAGVPCPSCGALQTAPSGQGREMGCGACGHHWAPRAGDPVTSPD